jgi:hypothetical protein
MAQTRISAGDIAMDSAAPRGAIRYRCESSSRL